MNLESVAWCSIYPPIGIARVGGSKTEYFIGPEVAGQDRTPPGKNGWKDAEGLLLRQVARFRIYAFDDNNNLLGELKAGDANVEVEWSVHVANHKAAWYNFDMAMDIPEFDGSAGLPPKRSARRNATIAGGARKQLVIDPGARTISGKKTSGKKYQLDGGKFFGTEVSLGELRTDEEGRLLVFGGPGISASHPKNQPAVTFANNDGWHDDIADGPVTATVTIKGKPMAVEHAWIVVGPPDYSPGVTPVTTMYDIVFDAACQLDGSQRPHLPSFTSDILPIFARLAAYQWVNGGFGKMWGWKGAEDFGAIVTTLGSNSDFARPMREEIFSRFRNPDFSSMDAPGIPPVYGDGVDIPATNPRQWYTVTPLQYEFLRQWAEGAFVSDYDPSYVAPTSIDQVPLAAQPMALTKAALENCIGGPFHPGCEMTWPLRQPIMYSAPFRIKLRTEEPRDYGDWMTSRVVLSVGGPLDGSGAGDISKWMAVPWQTDTSSCLYAYIGYQDGAFLPTFWPARVPNNVLTAAQYSVVVDPTISPAERQLSFAYDARQYWLRVLSPRAQSKKVINEFVKEWNGVGVVTQRPGAPDDVGNPRPNFPPVMFVEEGVSIKPVADADAGRQPLTLPNPRDLR
ncbi:MAG TPA: LodA/GoxA family CTQ-dependent oxidase [Thermoanaerobaculia bacterium]|nr:LodA/GoxA family CTQ-dependent oxidase [Thermoanaerobaculia bacterium]